MTKSRGLSWLFGAPAVVLALLVEAGCAHPKGGIGEPAVRDAQTKQIYLKSGGDFYTVVAHSPEIAPLIKIGYTKTDRDALTSALRDALRIQVSDQGIVQAATRDLEGQKDTTNYGAVWLRDSLWAYLGLRETNTRDASLILSRMLDYLASPDQLRRMDNIITNPERAAGPGGNMEVIHVRFDGESPTFADVMVKGRPQEWNHRQNDATGLFFDLALRALSGGELDPARLSDAHWRLLASLPCYFERLKFYDMEDAGSWEEINRVNTSSVGLVTSGLENLLNLISKTPSSAFVKSLKAKAATFKKSACVSESVLRRLVDAGYDRVHRQLRAGGESPLYPLDSPKYRRADAALLNLVYPARLNRLSREDKLAVTHIVQPLIGRVGVKRYLFDSYQSGNFWLEESSSKDVDSRTDDTSSAAAFAARGKLFIRGTEAQWFFDSWLSTVYARLSRENSDSNLTRLQVVHLNRALGQVTAGAPARTLGADGNPVPPLAVPESYNQLVRGDVNEFSPSPITPLNWAKAALLIALRELPESP